MMVNSQFCTDESVNYLLNYSKNIVDQFCGPCSDREGRVMQYAIFAGLLSYYGVDRVNEIAQTFRNNQFIFTKGSVLDFVARQPDVVQGVIDAASDPNNCALYWKKYYPDATGLNWFSDGRIIVSENRNQAPDFTLENTTHEVNHAITSTLKDVLYVSKDSVWTRMGLKLKKAGAPNKRNEIIEEAVNVLQTAEIMDHILSFSHYNIKDREIKYFLDSMRYAASKKREGQGYFKVSPLIRPLYEDANFKVALKRRRMDGNIGYVSDLFDSRVGQNGFSNLADACDRIYDRRTASQDVIAQQARVKQLVKAYTH